PSRPSRARSADARTGASCISAPQRTCGPLTRISTTSSRCATNTIPTASSATSTSPAFWADLPARERVSQRVTRVRVAPSQRPGRMAPSTSTDRARGGDVDTHTADIVRLAWTRGLGLPDDAFTADDASGVVVDDALPGVEFVELFARRILRGPAWMVDRVAGLPASAFHDGSALAALTRARGAPEARRDVGALRTTARERLAYRDHYSGPAEHRGAARADAAPDEQVPTISHSPADAALVLDACPSDDAADVAGVLAEPVQSAKSGAAHGEPS